MDATGHAGLLAASAACAAGLTAMPEVILVHISVEGVGGQERVWGWHLRRMGGRAKW